MKWQMISPQQKKYILVLITMTMMGICLIWLGNGSGHEQEIMPKEQETAEVLAQPKKELSAQEELEEQLAAILSRIDGAGKVQVKITVDGDGTREYAYDEQQTERETWQEGEQQITPLTKETQLNKTMVMASQGQGLTEPVTIKTIYPEVVGVLVVAQGAGDQVIQENLTQAVETVLGLPAHKVIVMAATIGEEH